MTLFEQQALQQLCIMQEKQIAELRRELEKTPPLRAKDCERYFDRYGLRREVAK